MQASSNFVLFDTFMVPLAWQAIKLTIFLVKFSCCYSVLVFEQERQRPTTWHLNPTCSVSSTGPSLCLYGYVLQCHNWLSIGSKFLEGNHITVDPTKHNCVVELGNA